MFGITRKPLDPMLELLYNLERRMGRVFNEPFGLAEWPTEVVGAWTPVVDIVEEPEVIRIVAEIPGVKPEDVKVTVEGNLLTIRGKKEQRIEEKSEQVHRYERADGAFERTFTLPATVDPAKIQATYGLLRLVLPKVEKAKPKLIEVKVG